MWDTLERMLEGERRPKTKCGPSLSITWRPKGGHCCQHACVLWDFQFFVSQSLLGMVCHPHSFLQPVFVPSASYFFNKAMNNLHSNIHTHTQAQYSPLA